MDNDNEFIHVDEEQQTPQPNNAQAQIVSPGRGYHWVERSLSEIFVPHFGKWFLAGLIYSIMSTVLPLLGYAVAMLLVILNPMFMAGGYLGAHKAQQKTGPITPQQFFEGFAHPKKFALLAYSGFLTLVMLIIAFGFFSAIGTEQIEALNFAALQGGTDQAAIQAELEAIFHTFRPYLIWMFIISIGITLASWFAPNLILFHAQNPISAFANSFIGGVKNILPMIVLLLVLIGLSIIIGLILLVVSLIFTALLPPLAAELLINTLLAAITIPILVGVAYISYREIFLGDVKESKNSL